MTNQERKEINEYLAERLFGLKKGTDWGQQSKHDFVWYTADELGDEEGAYKCLLCEKYFAKEVDEVCYIKQPPDYIANYQPVLQRLLLLEDVIKIEVNKAYSKPYNIAHLCYQVFIHTSSGQRYAHYAWCDLGEAIGRAAVEFLKAREGK